ncbi:MAG: glycosyltransferase family 2 protein [Planctomycetes bacterium]|nr:glycosyltransferase family 2 protein [Planctomycetota bacterium]
MTRPLVTVVLPTFNREALLPRALDSVIAQTYDNWESVVVDDGSTDGTAGVLDRYAATISEESIVKSEERGASAPFAGRIGDRFVVIRQENRGSSSARNVGIEAARGRFIAFLDSDDEFSPTKLQRQVELFERRPELGFVYSDYAYVDLDGARHESAFSTIHQTARRISYGAIGPGLRVCSDDLFGHLIRRYFIATIVGMVRRDVLGRTIRFAQGQSYAEEWLFFLHVVRRCRAGFVDESLSVHHHTKGSLARTDAHRNTVRYRNLLAAMSEAFDDLPAESRGIIRSNLAGTYRQLGYDAYRARKFGEARVNFAKSFRQRATLQALLGLGDSVLRAVAAGLIGKRADRERDRADSSMTPTALETGGRFIG